MDGRRLVDRFAVGTEAEVLFRGPSGETWVPGRVEAHAHPGVWVRVAGGSRWFVTNGGRIRERPAGGPGDARRSPAAQHVPDAPVTGSRPAVLCKIATADEWAEMGATGTFPGSAADRRDGFIHFSTAAQVRSTAAKHFGGRTDLVLIEVDAARLDRDVPGALRWEPARGGDLFPHLHAPLRADAVLRVRPIRAGPDGAAEFPEDVGAG